MENELLIPDAPWVIDRNHARCDGCGFVYPTDDPYYFLGCEVCIEDGVFDLEDDEDWEEFDEEMYWESLEESETSAAIAQDWEFM